MSRDQDRKGSSSDEKIRVKGNYGNDIGFEYTGSGIIKEHNNDVSKWVFLFEIKFSSQLTSSITEFKFFLN